MKKILTYEILMILAFTMLFLITGVTFGLLFVAGIVQSAILYFAFHSAYKKSGKKHNQIAYRTIFSAFLLFSISFGIIEAVIIKNAVESHQIKDQDTDAVIILGAGLNGYNLSNTLKERLEQGLELLKTHENVPVIVSGGQGPGEAIPEAEAMGAYLIERGIQKNRILYDVSSTTTYENLRNSRLILEKEGLHNKKVVIVTSDYHTYRAEKIGEELGLNSTGLGSESPLYITANYLIREYFAIVKMILNGGTDLDP